MSKLLITPAVHEEIIKHITRAIAQSYNNYVIAGDKNQDPRLFRRKLSMLLNGQIESSSVYFRDSSTIPLP